MDVSFFRGHPSTDLLPCQSILAASAAVLGGDKPTYFDSANRHPLTYGTDEGAQWVRSQIAAWQNKTLGGSTTADCINLTNGASFGVASALLQCTSPQHTRRAFVVTPTYFLINNILEDAGFRDKLTPVLETEDGLDLDGLISYLEKDKVGTDEPPKGSSPRKKIVYRYVMYLVPTFSNPRGHSLSLDQRKRILEIARKYNVLLLCDEVYGWLEFHGSPKPDLLVDLDRQSLPAGSPGSVIANFSMSKILGPGLRVGWQDTASPQLAYQLSQFGACISGGTPAQLNTYIVGTLMETGEVNEVIDRLNRVYGERSRLYREAMETYFPPGTQIEGGDGGYFFWVTLPAGYDVDAITKECKEKGIILAPGNHFEVFGDTQGWGERSFRVSLSFYSSAEAVPAIREWGAVINRHKTQGLRGKGQGPN